MKLINKLNLITETITLSDSDKALCKIMTNLGCEKFSYNYYSHNFHETRKIRHVLCTQQAKDWQEHYSANRYDQIDPILNRMRKSHLPLSWTLEDELIKNSKKQKPLFSDAIEFGLQGGFAVPIHAPLGEFANLVVQEASMINEIERYPEIKLSLQLIAYHYHARVSYFLEKENEISGIQPLTPREMECLQLTMQHKTAKEIAKILQVSPRTIGFHIENAIRKLGVKNKYQAITKANQLSLFL